MPARYHLLEAKPSEQRYQQSFKGDQGQVFPYTITWTHRECGKRIGRRRPTSVRKFPAPNIKFIGIIAPEITTPVYGVGADQNSLTLRDSDATNGSIFDR